MKVVLTCGVFDVIHIGHINLLRRAKDLGDYLVIGIQDDKSVQIRKPKPILNTHERVEQMKSLQIADSVISYNEPYTTSLTLKRVNPDVFVHGGDWEQVDRTEIKSYMEKNSIELVIFPRTEGISSSEIKKRIIQTQVKNKTSNITSLDRKRSTKLKIIHKF